MLLSRRSCFTATLGFCRDCISNINVRKNHSPAIIIASGHKQAFANKRIHGPYYNVAVSRGFSSISGTISTQTSSSGGVWAPTSAKRDKLTELTAELQWDKNQRSLNDVATLEEKMDLHLVEGLLALLEESDLGNTKANPEIQATLHELNLFLQNQEKALPSFITQEQYQYYLEQLLAFVHATKQRIISSNTDRHINPLMYIRDFCIYDSKENSLGLSSAEISSLSQETTPPFTRCQLYLQLTLLESCIVRLQSGWNDFMLASNTEMDRRAHESIGVDPASSPSTALMDITKLRRVLLSHFHGSCTDRIQALWDLKDVNNDNRIEKDDLEPLITWSMRPVQDTFQSFVLESMKVCPLRLDPQKNPMHLQDVKLEQGYFGQDTWYFLSTFSHYLTHEENQLLHKTLDSFVAPSSSSKSVWSMYKEYKRKRENDRVEKWMLKYLQKTIRNHFHIEVETPHRLRCIYAWADKGHQQGKVESVLIQDLMNPSSVTSLFKGNRKRYVEFEPQISYDEFRSMQSIHFTHLDRMGSELCTSLKEEIWIHEGKQRQGVEWRREAMIFLTIVTMVDIFISII